MSLLQNAMEPHVILQKSSVADGYGGETVSWIEGADFTAAVTLDNSIEARIADKQGVTALYTITTGKEINLKYHDIIKRVKDGKIFRVTSNGDDNHTPKTASLNMRQVSAEEWRLDNE